MMEATINSQDFISAMKAAYDSGIDCVMLGINAADKAVDLVGQYTSPRESGSKFVYYRRLYAPNNGNASCACRLVFSKAQWAQRLGFIKGGRVSINYDPESKTGSVDSDGTTIGTEDSFGVVPSDYDDAPYEFADFEEKTAFVCPASQLYNSLNQLSGLKDDSAIAGQQCLIFETRNGAVYLTYTATKEWRSYRMDGNIEDFFDVKFSMSSALKFIKCLKPAARDKGAAIKVIKLYDSAGVLRKVAFKPTWQGGAMWVVDASEDKDVFGRDLRSVCTGEFVNAVLKSENCCALVYNADALHAALADVRGALKVTKGRNAFSNAFLSYTTGAAQMEVVPDGYDSDILMDITRRVDVYKTDIRQQFISVYITISIEQTMRILSLWKGKDVMMSLSGHESPVVLSVLDQHNYGDAFPRAAIIMPFYNGPKAEAHEARESSLEGKRF